jgi:transposase
MFGHGGPVKVFVATRPVDFRKGIDLPPESSLNLM